MKRSLLVLGMVGLLFAASEASAAPRNAGWQNINNVGNGGLPYVAPNLKQIGEGGLHNGLPNIKTIGEGGLNNALPNRNFGRGYNPNRPNLKNIGNGGLYDAFPRVRRRSM